MRSDTAAGDAAASDAPASYAPANDGSANDGSANDVAASDTKASDTKASDTKASDTKASDTKGSNTKGSNTKGTVLNDLLKRLFDLLVAALLLIVLSPLLLLLALAVASRLGRPVLFRQRRPGLRGRIFTIYKFRTMTSERDGEGRLKPDEERLTPFGRWLRSTSLDELPELINVLKGEMSLVGPRPLKVEYLERYDSFQARRHQVRPGITGWAQVNGRNTLSWPEKFQMDVWYVENRSLLLDLKILLLTVAAVVRRQGVSAEQHATMPEFEGNGRE